jgi:hypothetical protein
VVNDKNDATNSYNKCKVIPYYRDDDIDDVNSVSPSSQDLVFTREEKEKNKTKKLFLSVAKGYLDISDPEEFFQDSFKVGFFISYSYPLANKMRLLFL